MIKFQNDELSEKEGKRRKYFNIYVGMLQMFHLQFTLRSRERKMIRRNEKQIIKNILIYNMNVKKIRIEKKHCKFHASLPIVQQSQTPLGDRAYLRILLARAAP